MDSSDRKKVAVIAKYITESFSDSDWFSLGQVTGKLKTITDHPRLFRSLSFGDEDYPYCVAEVLDTIFSEDSKLIPEVIDYFDIDLWYQQKDPEKYKKIFISSAIKSADFWKDGYIKMFISHLSSNRERMSAMKVGLANWGISAFVAHEDIEASREWRDEVEAGLESMDVLVALVEPGFKESDWCVQEVGYALGCKVDIIPLRAGLDPFGFFGKYQGIQVKGKQAAQVANEIVQTLLKKPQHRNVLLQSMSKAFASLQSKNKTELISLLDSWEIITDQQLKALLEQASLSDFERNSLKSLIGRVGAFKVLEPAISTSKFDSFDDEIPF
jgi:hypothetical protein